MIEIIFFIFGAAIGSFLNVLILRFPDFKSILTGRSHCPHCKKILTFFELIPILSFIVLFGRCKNCKKPISWQYPLVEVAAGTLFVLFYSYFGLTPSLFFYLIIACLSIVIFVFDLKYLEIPEIFAWSLLVVAILVSIFSTDFNLLNFIYGGIISGGVIAAFVWFSKERLMGAGDIKIALAFGLIFGPQKSFLFLFLSFVIGALVGIILIAGKKKGLKSQVAFAPFLFIAALITLLWGSEIINFYLNFAIM